MKTGFQQVWKFVWRKEYPDRETSSAQVSKQIHSMVGYFIYSAEEKRGKYEDKSEKISCGFVRYSYVV